MAMRRSHNLHTIYKAEVIEHPFPPVVDSGVDLTWANTIIYEISKLCMAIIFPFYNISSSNFAVILFWHAVSNCGDRFLFLD